MLTRIELLKIGETDVSNYAISATSTINTVGIRVGDGGTKAALLILCNASTNLTLLYQLSRDNVNFYTPVDSTNGTLSTLINGSLTTNRYVCFEPEAGEYMRFRIESASLSFTSTLHFIQQEEIV